MIKLTLIALCLFASAVAAASADLYQWTDAQGVVHFSDNPQAVPKEMRGSAQVKVRKDFFTITLKAAPAPATQAESSTTSASNPHASANVHPAPETPLQVIYAPQESTVVVINNGGHRAKHHHYQPCHGCAPAFRADFNDRRYVHPSVFSGGARQYIRP